MLYVFFACGFGAVMQPSIHTLLRLAWLVESGTPPQNIFKRIPCLSVGVMGSNCNLIRNLRVGVATHWFVPVLLLSSGVNCIYPEENP